MSVSDCFGIDIGGSGIKGAPVDLARGETTAKRKRIVTPQPATPAAVAAVAADIVAHFGYDGPVGCALPSVVQGGVVRSAANIDESWIGVDGQALFESQLQRRVALLNDADAAGIAEMRFGAGRDEQGLVLLLTFGTGIGSAIFYKGELVPNTELGHAYFRGGEAEEYAAAALVEREELELEWWASRVNELLAHFEALFSPDLIIFGGGISKRFKEFENRLETRARLEPARLRNNAGIVGAALAARNLI
jgi:polyphosphate glucokinase